MSDILFIKTSSLGDVIHHMPAVSDARRHRPDARIGWVVEEAFAPLVRLHRAVDSVIPVASRRWRRAAMSPSTWREIVDVLARDARADPRHGDRRARAGALGGDRALRARPAPRLRPRERARVARALLLRRALPRRSVAARDHAQPHADRAGARLCARRPARLRSRSRGADRQRAGRATRSCCTRPRGPRRNGRSRAGSSLRARLRRADFRRCCRGAPRPSGGAAPRSPPRCRARGCRTFSRSTGWRG